MSIPSSPCSDPNDQSTNVPRTQSRNPFLFVVGCPRSGTTLFQRMLTRHPQLALANDVYFVTRSLRRVAPQLGPLVRKSGDAPLTEELIESVRTYHRMYRLELGDDAVRSAGDRNSTYRHFLEDLFNQFASLNGKPLAGEKTPDYVRQLPFLHALFPWARIIHIVRDGRDVSMSVRDWAVRKGRGPAKLELWRDEPLATAALWWKWQVQAGMVAAKSLSENRYFEVRYEHLVAEPETEMNRVLEFLDLPLGHLLVAQSDNNSSEGRRRVDRPPQPGLRDWRRQLTGEDLALVDAMIGPFLEQIGYDRSIAEPAIDVTQRANHCLEWWHDHLERRRRRESLWLGSIPHVAPNDPPTSGN